MRMVQALSLDRLRRIDPCAVLSGAPVPRIGGLEPQEPHHFNRCPYADAAGNQLELSLGT